MRVRRIASVAAAALMLLGIPGGMTAARGADSQLYGFGLHSTATAISTIYNQPSFGVPTDPTFELRKVHSVADLDSGPSGHALASPLWPGDVIGNAPPSLALDTLLFNPTKLSQVDTLIQSVKDNKSIKMITGNSSGYPIRAERFYPANDGKTDATYEMAPGVRSDAHAVEDATVAQSTTGGAGVPGVITFGSLFSRSSSKVVKGQAIADSIARIQDLDLFGFIHLDSLVATATATSDGVTGTTTGNLQVSGLTILQGPGGKEAAKIVVDRSGFHAGSTTQDPFGVIATALFKKYLEPRGIDLYIGSPIDRNDGASADRSLVGLVMHLDARGMKKLLEAMPAQVRNALQNPSSNEAIAPIFQGPLPGLPDGLLSPTVAGYFASFFQGDQDTNFVFGAVAATSNGSPALPDFVPPVIPQIPPAFPPVLSPGGFTGGGGGGGGGGGVGNPTVGSLPLTPVAVVGIPFAILGIVIAAGLVGSRGLRTFADRVVAAPAAARCSLEEK